MEETKKKTSTGRFSLASDQNVTNTPNSWAQDLPPTHDDCRARFYEHYRKEAEEYDKETIKKYDEDLNTTLIFVSFVQGSGSPILTRVTGWSILRGHLRIHHRPQLSAPTGPERRNRRSPPCSHLQDRQYHVRQRGSNPPAMDRPSAHGRPRPSHPLRESRHFTPLRTPCDARQTMVESIRVDRRTRDRY